VRIHAFQIHINYISHCKLQMENGRTFEDGGELSLVRPSRVYGRHAVRSNFGRCHVLNHETRGSFARFNRRTVTSTEFFVAEVPLGLRYWKTRHGDWNKKCSSGLHCLSALVLFIVLNDWRNYKGIQTAITLSYGCQADSCECIDQIVTV